MAKFHQLAKSRSVKHATTHLNSGICPGPAIAFCITEDQVLKIQPKANGDVLFALSRRLDAESLSDLSRAVPVRHTVRGFGLTIRGGQ